MQELSAAGIPARNIRLIILLLASFCAQAASAAGFNELIGDPTAAREADFCEWAYGDRDSYGPMIDLKSTMENENGDLSQQTVVSAILIEAGTKVAIAANGRKKCKRELGKGRKKFDKSLRKNTRKFQSKTAFDASDIPEIAAIQSEITRLWVQDQAARITYVGLQTEAKKGAAYWARKLSVANAVLADDEATRFMISTLENVDWIDNTRFGSPVSRHAWILVQHADKHPKFQEQALLRMETYVSAGGVLRRDYAHLWDRVAVNNGRLQRYGTQPTWKCAEGGLTLQAMEDPDNVDLRRAEMGLESAASALAEMSRSTCR